METAHTVTLLIWEDFPAQMELQVEYMSLDLTFHNAEPQSDQKR